MVTKVSKRKYYRSLVTYDYLNISSYLLVTYVWLKYTLPLVTIDILNIYCLLSSYHTIDFYNIFSLDTSYLCITTLCTSIIL